MGRDRTVRELVPVQVLFHQSGAGVSTLDGLALTAWTSTEGQVYPAGWPMTWAFQHDDGSAAEEVRSTFDRWASTAETVEMGTFRTEGRTWFVMLADQERVVLEIESG